ncbi:hypothetical protein Bca101_017286 [Brassica carinata]
MASISNEPEREHRDEEESGANEDEDTGAQVAPIIKLEEVAVTTGEENEDAILDLKSKLYRFDKDGSQWKERGAGTVKFLKHKESGKIRLVMRQSKTLKICANHLVTSGMSVQEHAGNDKSCVWHARDFSDGELKDELFCIRFASVEITVEGYHGCLLSDSLLKVAIQLEVSGNMCSVAGLGWCRRVVLETVSYCKAFMQKFKEVAESEEEKEESKEASDTAGLLEKLTVEEKSTEEKKEEKPVEKVASAEAEKAVEEKKTEESVPSA